MGMKEHSEKQTNKPLMVSTTGLIAANLLPIGGVFFFDWSVFEILLLFWAENLIIGAFTIARMVTLMTREKRDGMLFQIVTFIPAYGLFTLVHLVFLIGLFAPGFGFFVADKGGAGLAWSTFFVSVIGLVISHGSSFINNFIGQGEYKRISNRELMTGPYNRILVMQVTVLLGGLVVVLLGEMIYALILLIVLKIGIDVRMHLLDHRRMRRRAQHREEVARNIADPDHARRDSVFRGWDDFDNQDKP